MFHMKNNFIKIMIAVAVLFTASCKKDPLDKIPDNRLQLEDIFADASLARGFLVDSYVDIPQYQDSYYFFQMLATKSDEAVDADGFSADLWNSGGQTVSNFAIQPGNNGYTYWDRYWGAIRKANLFIANADKVTVSEDPNNTKAWSAQSKKQYIAEARFLRAFFHFELIKNYGGVPITETLYDANTNFAAIKRNTFDEVAKWIVKECDAIKNDMPDRRDDNSSDPNIKGVGRGSKMIAMCLKAKALLYAASPLHNPANDMTRYTAASIASKDVLEFSVSSGLYRLYYSATPTNGTLNAYDVNRIRDNGNPAIQPEVIWQHPSPPNGVGHTSYANGIPSTNNFKAGVCPTQELVDAFEMKNGTAPITGYSDANHTVPIINAASGYNDSDPYTNRDPRLLAFIFYNNSLWGKKGSVDYFLQAYNGGQDQINAADRRFTKTGYYLHKFVDPTRGSGNLSLAGGSSYWPLFRLAEFYLDFAEAENEVNGPSLNIIDALNTIRRRATMPDYTLAQFNGDKAKLRERIRNERRVELCFEEHRFYDVRRWKILDQTDQVMSGNSITKTGTNAFTYSRFRVPGARLAFDSKYLLFPIPINEMVKFPLWTQNPGW